MVPDATVSSVQVGGAASATAARRLLDAASPTGTTLRIHDNIASLADMWRSLTLLGYVLAAVVAAHTRVLPVCIASASSVLQVYTSESLLAPKHSTRCCRLVCWHTWYIMVQYH